MTTVLPSPFTGRTAPCGGDRIALMGPSGSGKTTLLHLVSGLDEPTGGAITWPALGDRSVLRPGRVGVVFQSPSLMVAPLDVLENVALPLLLLGFDRRAAANAARAALERLGLGARCILVPAARRG